MKKDAKQEIYYIKFIAIISVIMAHTPISLQTIFINQLWGSISAVGVPIFLIISGYLFSLNTDDFKVFMYKKIKSLLLPWLFCGTITYIISALVGTQVERFNVKGWMNFLLGNGSLFYYMTILCTLYLITFYIRKNTIVLVLISIISGISILLTALDYLGDINLYLNPFNFIIYFVLGILLKDRWDILLELCQKYYRISLSVLIILLLVATYIRQGGYTGLLTIPISIISFLAVLGGYKKDKLKICKNIGKISFTIYLLHMPIAGGINLLIDKLGILMLLKPVIVITIMVIGIRFIKLIETKFKTVNKLSFLVGL